MRTWPWSQGAAPSISTLALNGVHGRLIPAPLMSQEKPLGEGS